MTLNDEVLVIVIVSKRKLDIILCVSHSLIRKNFNVIVLCPIESEIQSSKKYLRQYFYNIL